MTPVARSSAAPAAAQSLLEVSFPYAEVSAIARADRYARDGVYAAHKWWARRPPGVIRALLIASVLPADTSREAFWELYAADRGHLDGVHVGDPFMGGATTLVEASRLGASVTGIDVDPLAVLIAQEELACPGDPVELERVGKQFLQAATVSCSRYYATDNPDATPLHYFYLRQVTCADCDTVSLLYRTPVLARDAGKIGGVVRRRGAEVFCPFCRELRHLPLGRKGFRCCGRLHRLDRGTYTRAGHTCPGCATRRTHEHLQTGRLPRVLIAVEETVEGDHRRLRPPTESDHAATTAASRAAAGIADRIPTAAVAGIDGGRPALYGFSTIADLFTPRQQLVFASAFAWLEGRDLDAATRKRMTLAISNALSSNNALCGYATDYGRLAPLFMGVRSYAMPILAVELNPLHPTAGRGTLTATLRRMQRSLATEICRNVRHADGRIGQQRFRARTPTTSSVTCQSADRGFPSGLGGCDVIVTDPPYFDFIAYSDLSLLHRAWLWPDTDDGSMGGKPIYPVGEDPVADFATRLGRAFANAAGALKPGGTLTFTFHSTNPDAWDALAASLVKARLAVTAVFPVWTDARAAAHAHPGNCEWDLVFTCRPLAAGPATPLRESVVAWRAQLGDSGPAGNDLTNLTLGLLAARQANAGGRHEQG